MADNPENFTQHFKDSWDQTVGAWVSIFKGVRGASKLAAKETKETLARTYEDSRAEAIVNINKDIVRTIAHGGSTAVGMLVEKAKEVSGIGGNEVDNRHVEAETHGGLGFISTTSQKIFVGVVICVVVVQTGYIVYLYDRAQRAGNPARRLPKSDALRPASSPPSPQPMDLPAADDLPLGEEEEDRRLAASEARYRKEMEVESLDSEGF
ncbi:hypothetical protein ABL78_4184 [Leptomonas seymouri]|uniref:Uncharacterized protein n=1 Tax=Leptomonas seymouri TaxID=5684 RepID=A0A0N0P655_LEPSE|nr:hypothetical protein ABL78_4184 [Leptomonas seymouri]|eukprot:KPI86767.1 hypothetical protein ABL78_4184 [Leptomonas seymouri]